MLRENTNYILNKVLFLPYRIDPSHIDVQTTLLHLTIFSPCDKNTNDAIFLSFLTLQIFSSLLEQSYLYSERVVIIWRATSSSVSEGISA